MKARREERLFKKEKKKKEKRKHVSARDFPLDFWIPIRFSHSKILSLNFISRLRAPNLHLITPILPQTHITQFIFILLNTHSRLHSTIYISVNYFPPYSSTLYISPFLTQCGTWYHSRSSNHNFLDIFAFPSILILAIKKKLFLSPFSPHCPLLG